MRFRNFELQCRNRCQPGTPVFFERIQFNEQIEYKNGVILTMQPGYYTFTVQARAYSPGDKIGMWINVENIHMTYGER